MRKKTILTMVLLLATVMLMPLSGCKNKKVIPVFTYEENEDDTITITGLTDKGRADSKLTIPAQLDGSTVTAVAGEAFRDDYNVTEVVFEEGVKSIGDNVFLNCTMLQTIAFPQSLENVGTHVVTNTRWEKSRLESSNEIIVNNILLAVKENLTEYTVPENVVSIGSGVFYDNTVLEKITLNSRVEAIGNYAFSGCSSLTKLELPSSVKKIGYAAFNGCTKLELSVNSGVEEIGQDAFLDVEQLAYDGKLTGSPWGAKSIKE